ncbi:hypothetical protein [Streptomyces sp. NPDC059479]|uniref:hypothetical protein n=1 Tax=Streptomyces sp. NPDC059479 TaxID=3346848 RepID=UPI00367BCF8D
MTGADYVDGPVSGDLQRLRGIDTVLARAQQIRHEWEQVTALLAASPPGAREIYAERAAELRNAEGRRYADELSYSGQALAGAAEYLTERIGAEQPGPARRVHAALARSAPGLHRHGPRCRHRPHPQCPLPRTARADRPWPDGMQAAWRWSREWWRSSAPRLARVPWGASAADGAIAVADIAPVTTAGQAISSTTTNG